MSFPHEREVLVNADTMAAEFKKRDDRITTLLAVIEQCGQSLEAWRVYYTGEISKCDSEIERYTKEQDFHGVNFHQGRRSGLIQHDIGLQPLKDTLAAIRKVKEGK